MDAPLGPNSFIHSALHKKELFHLHVGLYSFYFTKTSSSVQLLFKQHSFHQFNYLIANST